MLKYLMMSSLIAFSLPFQAMKAEDEQIFVRHVTNILPLPLMQIGGCDFSCKPAPFPFRCTLHWSLLGLEPTPELYNFYNGERQPAPSREHEGKYIIIESLKAIAPFVVGAWPYDIFMLGPHMPSEQAIIFMPESEQISKPNFLGTIIYYSDTKKPKEACAIFLAQNPHLLIVTNISLVIAEKNLAHDSTNKLCALALAHLDNYGHDQIEQNTQIYKGLCYFARKREYHVSLHKISLENEDSIVIIFTYHDSNKLEQKILPRIFYSSDSANKFDLMIRMQNNKNYSFNKLLLNHNICANIIYRNHNNSLYFDLEKLSFFLQKARKEDDDEILAKTVPLYKRTFLALKQRLNNNNARARLKLFKHYCYEYWNL